MIANAQTRDNQCLLSGLFSNLSVIADAQTRDIQCLLSGLLMIVSTIANPVAAFLSQHLLMPWIG